MTRHDAPLLSDDPHPLPRWATQVPQSRADVVFQAGAVLAVLYPLLCDPAQGVPLALLGNRRALAAAVATARLEGRIVRPDDMRDAYHLTPPGAPRGPEGDLVAFWRDAMATRQVSMRSGSGDPVAASIQALHEVFLGDDRAEREACRAADATLAAAMGWPVAMPVMATAVSKALLRDLLAGQAYAEVQIGAGLVQCLRALLAEARLLRQKAAAIRAVTPKLRAKSAGAAVAVFLREDAVAPSTVLAPLVQGSDVRMTDRAARRLCDRLVSLGVAQELTGRATFRLYGIAQ